MKYSIFGIDQKEAVKHGLKIPECLMLTWANGIFGKSFAYRYEDEGHAFYWLKLDQFLKDYPIIQITKESLSQKFRKLVKDGFLLKQTEQTPNGQFGYYSPTPKFDSLFRSSHDSDQEEVEEIDPRHPIKKQGGKSHPIKKQAGTEKKQAGTEKKQAIPSSYNPEENTQPPQTPQLSTNNLSEEEEVVFNWLKETLPQVKDQNRFLVVVKKLSPKIIKSEYLKALFDFKKGKVDSIAVLLHRLETYQEPSKPLFSQPSNQSEKITKTLARQAVESSELGLNILDNPAAKETLESGVFAFFTKGTAR